MNPLSQSQFITVVQEWSDDELLFELEGVQTKSAPIKRKSLSGDEPDSDEEVRGEGFRAAVIRNVPEAFIKNWLKKVQDECKQSVHYVVAGKKIGIFAQGNVRKVEWAMFKFKPELDKEFQKYTQTKDFVKFLFF